MARGARRARVHDVHDLASAMPYVTVVHGPSGNPVYQVGGKSFVFFRTPRPDAVDPDTGERYTDVIVLWVESESDKRALVQDRDSPWFTTSHFDGHPSVLVRASRIAEISYRELTEMVESAWLAQASPTRAAKWLASHCADRRRSGPGGEAGHVTKVRSALDSRDTASRAARAERRWS